MINLLPPQQKEELKQEENFKLILTTGILFLVFLVYLSLILIAIEVYISGEVRVQEILFLQREKEINTPQSQTLQKSLATLNQTLSQLDDFYQNQIFFNGILEKISKTIPEGVYLTNLSLSPAPAKETWKLNCNLTGFSPSREILLKFKENLEKESAFGEVSFPTTAWVKQVDINFTVSFKTK